MNAPLTDRQRERADLAAFARERAAEVRRAGHDAYARECERAAQLIEQLGRELDSKRTAAALESWRPALTRRPVR